MTPTNIQNLSLNSSLSSEKRWDTTDFLTIFMIRHFKPSVTVAAVIAKTFDGIEKFLLVEELTRDGLKLNNPAGHLDAGESLIQACGRETMGIAGLWSPWKSPEGQWVNSFTMLTIHADDHPIFKNFTGLTSSGRLISKTSAWLSS